MSEQSEVSGKLILAGVDDGYASTKIYLGGGRHLKIMSSVRSGLHGLTSIHGQQSSDDSLGGYELNGVKYTVGDMVNGEGTRFDEYPGSDLNVVVVHHALRQALNVAGLAGSPVRIATGLPVADFYTENGINKDKINEKRKGFRGVVTSTEGKDPVDIRSSVVCAEAVSGFMDYALTDSGSLKPNVNLSNPVGVVDIGGRTTDCVWVCPPDRIDREHSGTANFGVLNALDTLESKLRAEYKLGEISRRLLEIAATTKKFRMFGKDIDVADMVDPILAEMTDRVYREVTRKMGTGAELDSIIFIGGGAALLPDVSKKFKNGVLAEAPEYANARGMYKFLKTRNG